MLPWSAFVWKAIPQLGTAIQFPHRFGAILSLAVAGLFAAAIESGLRRRSNREGVRRLTFITVAALLVIASGIVTWRADWCWVRGLRPRAAYPYDESRDVDGMYRTYVSRNSVAAFAALLGTTPNTYSVERTPVVRGGTKLVQGQGELNLLNRGPRKVVMSYVASGTSVMRMAQLYSPLWKTVLDQKSAGLGPRSSDQGLLEVPLVPGRHDLELLFEVGWPERYGVILSVASLVVVAAGVALQLLSNDRTRQMMLGWLRPAK
jgi:hypothetical protein